MLTLSLIPLKMLSKHYVENICEIITVLESFNI